MIVKPVRALAAAALLVGSSAVSAQSAAPLSLSASPAVQRSGAMTQDESSLRGGYGWILGIVALGILIFIISEASKDNELPGRPEDQAKKGRAGGATGKALSAKGHNVNWLEEFSLKTSGVCAVVADTAE